MLDGLEAADRLAELDALFGVVRGHVEHAGSTAQEGSGIKRGAAVEKAPGLFGSADRRRLVTLEAQPAEGTSEIHGRLSLDARTIAEVDGEYLFFSDDDGNVGDRRVRNGDVGSPGDARHRVTIDEAFDPPFFSGAGEGAGGEDALEERRRRDVSSDLFGEDGGLDHAETQPAARFGELHTGPALLDHRFPEDGVERLLFGGRRPYLLGRRQRAEQIGGRVLKGALIVGELEVHGRAGVY